KVKIDQIWSGTMGFAVHRMPLIGEVSPGLWLASAFGGHGINTTAMAAELFVSAVIEGDDRWKLFLPYELVWGGGAFGRAAIQLVYWSQRNRQTDTSKWGALPMDGWRAWQDRVAAQTASGVTTALLGRLGKQVGASGSQAPEVPARQDVEQVAAE